jgi:hypothetical protein
MKWIIGLLAALAALFVLLAYIGFADVPCQDGIWDEARQTCVPT